MVTIIGEDPYSFFKMVMNCFKCESFSMPNMLTYSQGHLGLVYFPSKFQIFTLSLHHINLMRMHGALNVNKRNN
jgi:hypothetical protein